jgi:hypothetical protein
MSTAALQEINLIDFTGGLNLRRNSFNLADNESPDMLNVEIDPRGGFFSRKGWVRWNSVDATDPTLWEPRNGYSHPRPNGTHITYIANNGTLLAANSDGAFSDLLIDVSASPHLADFASWGETVYIACGSNELPYKRTDTGTAVQLGDASAAFNDDYTVPSGGRMPQCDLVEAHAGYLFCAYTYEDGTTLYPNRLRWSHPSQVEDWASLDYIDIEAGGHRITALVSFQDHILIFKTDSVWALYGYDSESWQLIRVSRSAGTPSPTAVTSSENAVYFYSGSSRNGIYAYSGGQQIVHLSEKLRTALEEIEGSDDVWLGWVGRRLWCSMPWRPEGAVNDQSSAFVFDPEVGQEGAWVRHESALGHIKVIIQGSDTGTGQPLAAVCGCSGAAAVVRLDSQTRAEDIIMEGGGGEPFRLRYRTGWKDANFPERLKSWRRPRLVLRNPDFDVTLLVEAFYDYDTVTPVRSTQLIVAGPGDVPYWRDDGALAVEGDGFDWDDGTMWASEVTGSRIQRALPFGHSRALQLRFSVIPAALGAAWGVDAVVMKYIYREFTT